MARTAESGVVNRIGLVAYAAVGLLFLGAAALASGSPPASNQTARVADAFAAAMGHSCRLELGQPCSVSDLERLPVVDDVVRYRFSVRIGPGPFDVIRMHRVVKERRPFEPARTSESLFALHGSGTGGFEGSFLVNIVSGARPASQAMPVFLAQRGVDVWGMDLGWTLVPRDTTDFSFFADWGVEKEVRQVRAGLGIARALRAVTGADGGRMDFLGWSYGGFLGYVLVAEESQLPAWRRHVKGFVPVDIPVKFAAGALPGWVCDSASGQQSRHASGDYADDMSYFWSIGNLALDDPMGASPVWPGFSNWQAALFEGSGPYGYYGVTEAFHMVAGPFDDLGYPTGFFYTDPDLFVRGLASAEVWWKPVLSGADQLSTWCDLADVPFDDHLGDVRIPTLYLGAAGGVGTAGAYSTTLLGSPDVTVRIVALRPAGEETLDYGHADLWDADNAAQLVWRPILHWLRQHGTCR